MEMVNERNNFIYLVISLLVLIFASAVSHVRPPTAPLIFGRVAAQAVLAEELRCHHHIEVGSRFERRQPIALRVPELVQRYQIGHGLYPCKFQPQDGRLLRWLPVAVGQVRRIAPGKPGPVLLRRRLLRLAALAAESGQVLWSRDISSYKGVAADWNSLYTIRDEGEIIAVVRSQRYDDRVADCLLNIGDSQGVEACQGRSLRCI